MSIKDYFDGSLIQNPFFEYLKWISSKLFYQSKYWGKHLRIGYGVSLNKVTFGSYNVISKNVKISNSKLGDFTYISDSSVILESDIGKFCSIGPNVRIAPGIHPTKKFVSTHPATFLKNHYIKSFSKNDYFQFHKRVTIGNDVWIGANVLIIDGVKIGDGAVIAANSVVTRDVLPYEIVGGVPAKNIRFRFNETQIKKLLHFEWWNKPYSWLDEFSERFIDVDKFINNNPEHEKD
jgi:acetyltransferase-like isoleucine patch superfamily enzyme